MFGGGLGVRILMIMFMTVVVGLCLLMGARREGGKAGCAAGNGWRRVWHINLPVVVRLDDGRGAHT